ncbi:thioredoxin [Halosimplex litoreum]|uniref:Thioredoxin n=1 Tax=Halosimplex litoreum TaxID=1198301 RepID=A0A7T3KV58_9EURY|nr:thioredoxin [Halosimplex litoreum]QPV62984.1 thioredoxin [Halosimplex litoreum]
MSDASDDATDEELERIRERKRERLEAGESSTLSGDSATDESEPGVGGVATPDDPVHIETESEFEETVAEGVVLVDFYADWCGPCKMLEPIVEDIAETTDATVAKVDVDAHQGLAREYGVQGVPTLVLFVDGEPAERRVGVQDEGALRELVGQHV